MRFRTELAGQHIELRKGLSYKGSNLVDESEVGLLTIDAFITGGGYKRGSEKPYDGDYKNEHVAEPGDVLLAMTEQQEGLLASPLKVPEDLGGMSELVFSLDVAKVIATSGEVRPEFLFNFLRVPINRRRAAYGDTGTTVQRLPYDVIYEQLIPLPSVEEQDRINSFIATLDRKIELNTAMAATMERIAHSIFKSWFIDFDPVKAKMAGVKPVGMDDATAALFPDSMEDSELGQIPTGWSKSSMGNFVQARRGKVITKSKTSEGSIPVIAGGLEPAYFHNVANVLWPAVTVSASGANAGFVRLNLEDIWASDCSYISKSETESVYTCYLFLKVQQEVIFSMQQGGAQPHIYPSDLSRLNFPVPGDLRIFERFEGLIAVMFEKVRSLNNQTALFIAIRDSLLPRLISGELQIPEEMLVS